MKKRLLKYIIVLVLYFCSCSLFGQNINATYKNFPLSKVLTSISNDYKVTFAFDNALVEKIIINKSFTNKPLVEVLTELLAETNLVFSKNAEVYMIIPDKHKLVQTPSAAPVVVEKPKPLCHIMGVVKDRNSGEQLPFATVFINGTNIATATNNTGYFNLIANGCDTMEITIRYIGYKTMVLRVPAQEKSELITVNVENDITDLKEIVVEKKENVMENSSLSEPIKIKMNTAKMSEMPSLSEQDITAPLQMMPGIDGSTETASGFLIRKSKADKNLIMYDGFTIYQIDHFFGSFSSLNSKAIKDIQVYKSGYDARFGGRTGGFLEITGKSGNMYKPVVDVGMDMLSADASIELPLVKDKLSLIMVGRHSFTEYLQTPLFITLFNNVRYDMEQYYRTYPKAFQSNSENPVYGFSDLHSKLTYKAKENQVFSLSYFSSLDKMHFDQNYQFPAIHETEKWGTTGMSFRYTGNITSKWQQDIVLGSSITQNNSMQNDTSLHEYVRKHKTITDKIISYDTIHNKITDNSFSYYNTVQLNTRNTIQFGIALNNVKSEFASAYGVSSLFVNRTDSSSDYNKQALITCPYLQYIYNNKRFMIESGVRANHYSITQKNYLELRFQVSYKIKEKVLLKASAGNYHQFVNKIQLVKNQEYQNAWVISDGKLFPVVSSRNVMLGLNYKINASSNLDIEMYHRQTDNMTHVFTFYKRDDNDKISQTRKYYFGNNYANGIDVMLRKSIGNYQLWVAYTLSKSSMYDEKLNNGKRYAATDDQLHELKLFNGYKYKNWMISLSAIYGSGKVWYNAIYAKTGKEAKVIDFEKNHLPAYYRLDAGLSYNHRFHKADFSAGVNIFNVLNIKNKKAVSQKLSNNILENIEENKNIIETTDVYGLGFAPNLFINIKF